MDVNMNKMFSVSSNVSLDPGLVCDENFKNHGYFEGRDMGDPLGSPRVALLFAPRAAKTSPVDLRGDGFGPRNLP